MGNSIQLRRAKSGQLTLSEQQEAAAKVKSYSAMEKVALVSWPPALMTTALLVMLGAASTWASIAGFISASATLIYSSIQLGKSQRELELITEEMIRERHLAEAESLGVDPSHLVEKWQSEHHQRLYPVRDSWKEKHRDLYERVAARSENP